MEISTLIEQLEDDQQPIPVEDTIKVLADLQQQLEQLQQQVEQLGLERTEWKDTAAANQELLQQSQQELAEARQSLTDRVAGKTGLVRDQQAVDRFLSRSANLSLAELEVELEELDSILRERYQVQPVAQPQTPQQIEAPQLTYNQLTQFKI